MIKGLYFKLNLNNERDKFIYDFFKTYPKKIGKDKVEMLFMLIRHWRFNHVMEDYDADEHS